MKTILAMFFSLTLCVTAAQTGSSAKHYALFFAVRDYPEGWTQLSNPLRDAQLIGDMLRSDFGFQVDILENPDKRAMLDKITEYRNRKYGPEDQLFIFFSGHGIFDSQQFQEGYFAPHGALPDDALYDSYLPYIRLRNWINAVPCPHILTVFDACQSGAFDEKMALGQTPSVAPAQNWEVQDTAMVHSLLKRRSRLFITSVSLGYAPDGKPNTNSPFALALWQALGVKGSDGIISFAEIKEVIPFAVKEAHYGTFGDHEAGGEFLFISARRTLNRRTKLADAVYGENEDFLLENKTLFDKRDGRNYPTEIIGPTIWMAGDLQYKARVFSQADIKLLYEKYPYASDLEPFTKFSGFIYSFNEAQTVCPKGWRLPILEDYYAAVRQLGGYIDEKKKEADEITSQKLCNDALHLISSYSNYHGNQYWTGQTLNGLPCVYGFNHHFGTNEYCGTGLESNASRLHKCRCIRAITPPDTILEGWNPAVRPQAVFLLGTSSTAATTLADYLEKSRGYQVLKLERPSYLDIVHWLGNYQGANAYIASTQLIIYVESAGGFNNAEDGAFFIPSTQKPGAAPDTIFLEELQQMADRLPFGQIMLLSDLDCKTLQHSIERASGLSSTATAIDADSKPTAVRGKPENPFSPNSRQNLLSSWMEQLNRKQRARVSFTRLKTESEKSIASRILELFMEQETDQILDWNMLYDSLQMSMPLLPRNPFGRHHTYSNILFFNSKASELNYYQEFTPKTNPVAGNPALDMGAYLQFGDTLIMDKRDSARYKIGILNGKTWMLENLRYPAEGSDCMDEKAKTCAEWGRFYTWPAAQEACPVGWRLPESAEMESLKALPFSALNRFLQKAGKGSLSTFDTVDFTIEKIPKFGSTGEIDQFFYRGSTGKANLITFNSADQSIRIQEENVEQTPIHYSEKVIYRLTSHSIRCIKP